MDNIGGLFDRISRHYDLFNHLSSGWVDCYWRKRAVQALVPASSVLDVAIGTADLSIEMLRKGKAEHIEGLDLSAQMMQVGKHKVERLGLDNKVHFTLGSAQQMPYQDSSFDAVTCAYGVRNFQNPDEGLREFYRVLKPGGQLLILEFSYPQNKLIAAIYTFYFRYVMTRVGGYLTNDRSAFEYFYHSVRHFIQGNAMCERLQQCGFRSVRYRSFTFGISTLYLASKL